MVVVVVVVMVMVENCSTGAAHVKERCLDTSTHGLNSAYYLPLYVSVSVICMLCVGVLITTYTYILYTYTHLCA